MHLYVYRSIIYNSQAMEAAHVSTDRRRIKMRCVHHGLLHGHKEEGDLAICDNMDGPRGYDAEQVSQSEENTSHMISLTRETWKLSGQIRGTDRWLPEWGWGRTEWEKVSEGTNLQLQNRVWGCSAQHGD